MHFSSLLLFKTIYQRWIWGCCNIQDETLCVAIITERSILDVASALDPPLYTFQAVQKNLFRFYPLISENFGVKSFLVTIQATNILKSLLRAFTGICTAYFIRKEIFYNDIHFWWQVKIKIENKNITSYIKQSYIIKTKKNSHDIGHIIYLALNFFSSPP